MFIEDSFPAQTARSARWGFGLDFQPLVAACPVTATPRVGPLCSWERRVYQYLGVTPWMTVMRAPACWQASPGKGPVHRRCELERRRRDGPLTASPPCSCFRCNPPPFSATRFCAPPVSIVPGEWCGCHGVGLPAGLGMHCKPCQFCLFVGGHTACRCRRASPCCL